jgi:hypothetical protein
MCQNGAGETYEGEKVGEGYEEAKCGCFDRECYDLVNERVRFYPSCISHSHICAREGNVLLYPVRQRRRAQIRMTVMSVSQSTARPSQVSTIGISRGNFVESWSIDAATEVPIPHAACAMDRTEMTRKQTVESVKRRILG